MWDKKCKGKKLNVKYLTNTFTLQRSGYLRDQSISWLIKVDLKIQKQWAVNKVDMDQRGLPHVIVHIVSILVLGIHLSRRGLSCNKIFFPSIIIAILNRTLYIMKTTENVLWYLKLIDSTKYCLTYVEVLICHKS